MDLLRLQKYAMAHTAKKYGKEANPNISAPTNIGAKNVFVAAPKTDAKPKAATNSGGRPNMGPITQPRLAPIQNRGIISPP